MAKKGSSKGHKERCKAYRTSGQREKNKAYRLIRHLERQPKDEHAKKTLKGLPESAVNFATKLLFNRRSQSFTEATQK